MVPVVCKRCSRCKQFLPLELFSICRSSKDGKQNTCKNCHKKLSEARTKDAGKIKRLRNLEKEGKYECRHCKMPKPLSAFHKDKHRPNGHTTDCIECRNSYPKDPAKFREYTRRWRERNPEYSKNYYQNNKLREDSRARHKRAIKKSAAVTDKEAMLAWETIVSNDPCVYCGNSFENFEHIEPLSKGGEHSPENLVSSCESCNKSKSDKSMLLWMLS